MKPFIGISTEFRPDWLEGRPWHAHYLLVDYTATVRLAGGVPVLLPLAHDEIGHEMLSRLDGLLLTGGIDDIPPQAYGQEQHATTQPMPQERWLSEAAWLQFAVATKKPVLGVCLGMQTINVALGGTLIQDIPSQMPGAQQHSSSSRMHQHEVRLAEGSWLASVAPSTTVSVTSAHHQGIEKLARGCAVAATSLDGVIEAIEAPSRGILAAVQWHPERNVAQPDWLLRGFVRHCGSGG
jgi:putative glutamine amidotransferase